MENVRAGIAALKILSSPIGVLRFRRRGHAGDIHVARLRNGRSFRIRWGSGDLGTIIEVFGLRCYDAPGFEVRAGDVVFDVGANVGAYAVRAAAVPRTRVIAFECHPGNLAALKANVELNGLTNVVTDARALAGRSEKRYLEVGPGTVAHSLGADGVPVDAVSLPDAMREHGVERIHLLKMNCEGAEHEFLGAPDAPLDRIDRIIGQYHDQSAELKARLERAGFHVELTPIPAFQDMGFLRAERRPSKGA